MSEEQKHSPLPWRVKPTDPMKLECAPFEEGTVTASCWSSSFAPPSAEARANAQFIADAVNSHAALAETCDKLQRFKDYVHARLDAAGVPTDPDSPHKAEGCRIGGRLDVLIGKLSQLREATATFAALLKSERGRRLKPESLAQLVGMATGLCWLLGEDFVDAPGYVNPLPAILEDMRKGGAE